MSKRFTPTTKLIFVVLLFDLLLIALHLIFGTTSEIVNLDKEGNIPTYYAGIKLLAVGVLVLPLVRRPGRAGWAWLPFGLLFIYLAFDEMLEWHERLIIEVYPTLFAGLDWFPNHVFYWVILFLPGIILATVYISFLISHFRQMNTQTKKLYYTGLGLYVAVIILELLGGLLTNTPAGYHLMTLEESAELLGTTFFLWGTLILHSARSRVTY